MRSVIWRDNPEEGAIVQRICIVSEPSAVGGSKDRAAGSWIRKTTVADGTKTRELKLAVN
jgi:hypothetical protein